MPPRVHRCSSAASALLQPGPSEADTAEDGFLGTLDRQASKCTTRSRLKTLHGAGAQTPPAEQPAERVLSGNAAFVDAVQAGLARMLADLASAGVTERPLQVPAPCLAPSVSAQASTSAGRCH